MVECKDTLGRTIPAYTNYVGHKSNRLTGLGINNNGELVFPYGKEDTDYNIENNPTSGYVFNGATSVFWCRLRDLLPGEIKSTFTSVSSECFSATNLINQFDEFQECYPEEIWRLDIQRKYIRTFTGESIDNSKPKQDTQYLRDMMQGRKKYQRRQWVRNQEIYFGTKNLMNTVVGDDNRITFRCFTPTGDDVVVPPDYTLKITPYSDMYVSVMFGNGGVQQVRAKGGQEYTIECPLSSMDDTQVTIYGANRIQALNDLSACYIAANNFSMATKLRKLVLGNTTEGYNNSRLISLTLGNNKLLEELDIRNCGNLTGSINLAQCSNLLRLYASGTKLTGVTFATNGKVEIAYLPDTINNLVMRNLNNMIDFQASLDSIENLTLEGGTLDNLQIIRDTIDTLQVLYLYNIDWEIGDTELLNKMLKLFFSLVTGRVYVSGQIRQQELNKYANAWNDLEVTYDPAHMVTQYLITFVNDDGTVLFEEWVDRGEKPFDPIETGDIPIPTKESTPQYDFTFTNWDDLDSLALENRTITAQYSETIRQYTVTWYARKGVMLESVVANFGDEVVYSGELPTNTSEESSYVYNVFAGWDNSTGFIRENTDVYAIWDRAELPPVGKELKDMSCAEIYGVCAAEKASEYFEDKDYFDIQFGQDFTFSNIESKVILENKFFNGDEYFDTDIKLFDADSPSFTLAIDYEFVEPNNANATLMSCFDESGSEGFRLKFSTNPIIQWGDKSITVGSKNNRTMVVLRHIKGSNMLFSYISNLSDEIYDNEISKNESIRNRDTLSNNTLSFGAVRFDNDGGHDYYAKGWIHWCKIWFDDLGDYVAKNLAAWTHETIRMEFTGANRYRMVGNTSKKANGSFLSNNSLKLLKRVNPTNTNAGGWDASELRVFVNTRVLTALPIKWQSAIKKVKIPALAGNKSSEILFSEDYIYLPAMVEVGGSTSEPYINEGTLINFLTSNTTRIKSPELIIRDDAQFFTSSTDPTEDTSCTVREGDVWAISGTSYVYISADTAAKHTKIGFTNISNQRNKKASDGGYWINGAGTRQRTALVNSTSEFGYTNTAGKSGIISGGSYVATATQGIPIGFSI